MAHDLDGEGCQVLYEDRLYPVLAPAGQEDCGKLPQRPGDVVQPEVGEVRLRVRVGDADVDDVAHAGLPGRLEHHPGLLDGLLVGATVVVHPDPVGVEERVGALQVLA